MASTPRLSIIIATRFRFESLERTLRTLTFQRDKDFEVHLINDGGNPGSLDLVKTYSSQLTIFHHYSNIDTRRSIGAARTRNVGFRHCRAPRTLIIDEDCLCPPTVTQTHSMYLKKSIGVIGFRRHVPSEVHEKLTEAQLRNLPKIRSGPDNRDTKNGITRILHLIQKKSWQIQDRCWTCHISYPTELIREIGGFWEEFTVSGCEDCELGLRAFRKGLRFVLMREPCVYHQDHPQDPDQARDYPENRKRYWKTEKDTNLIVQNGGPLEFIDPLKVLDIRSNLGAYI